MNNILDVIVVGAGYAGLSASYHLKRLGLTHMVFERNRAGDSWRTQRWDNFRFNSTNKLNALPGEEIDVNGDLFGTAPAFVKVLEKYISKHKLPVNENSKVISIEKTGEYFQIKVSHNNEVKDFLSRQVLIASGCSNEIKIPSIAKKIAKQIKQLHTSEYKNAGQLPAGAVLVVGGGQSGIQITEDLVLSGRNVFFSTSEVGRVPRWYRGRDIFYWLKDLEFFDESEDQLRDAKAHDMRPPHVAGTGNGRDSLSLQSLAKKGAVILGKLRDASERTIYLEPNAAEHVKFADAFSNKVKRLIDEYVSRNNLEAPPPHHDEPDLQDIDSSCASSITELQLEAQGINTIIWSTGFNYDHSFIKLPVFDETGRLIHKQGIPTYPGVYFLGHPWLCNRKSTILFGIIEDVEFMVEHIYKYASSNPVITSPIVLKK